jgi:hypothetical protein
MNYEIIDVSADAGQPVRKHIDFDVLAFPGGQGGADKADPHDEITHKRIAPVDAGFEKITQHNLRKGHQDHRCQQDNQQRFLDPAQESIQAIPARHH